MSGVLDNLQDPRTISSSAALIATAVSSVYFYNEIQTIKANIAELREHLATILPSIDPKLRENIKSLNARIDSTQKEMNTLSHTLGSGSHPQVQTVTLPGYNRVTQKLHETKTVKPESVAKAVKGKEKKEHRVYTKVQVEPEPEVVEEEEDEDIANAVKLMQGN
jgi:hypothetical protein